MNNNRRYWLATFFRGVVAIVMGSAIFFLPDMARTLLLLPIAVVASIFGLAFYGLLDSAIILFTSYTTPWRLSRLALRIQGLTGMAIGLVLLSALYNRVQLEWFLYLATAQILATAIAEFIIARHATSHAISVWNYADATVALIWGVSFWLVAMKYGPYLTTHDITELIFGYLLAFGLAQCINSARMLRAQKAGRNVVQVRVAGQAT